MPEKRDSTSKLLSKHFGFTDEQILEIERKISNENAIQTFAIRLAHLKAYDLLNSDCLQKILNAKDPLPTAQEMVNTHKTQNPELGTYISLNLLTDEPEIQVTKYLYDKLPYRILDNENAHQSPSSRTTQTQTTPSDNENSHSKLLSNYFTVEEIFTIARKIFAPYNNRTTSETEAEKNLKRIQNFAENLAYLKNNGQFNDNTRKAITESSNPIQRTEEMVSGHKMSQRSGSYASDVKPAPAVNIPKGIITKNNEFLRSSTAIPPDLGKQHSYVDMSKPAAPTWAPTKTSTSSPAQLKSPENIEAAKFQIAKNMAEKAIADYFKIVTRHYGIFHTEGGALAADLLAGLNGKRISDFTTIKNYVKRIHDRAPESNSGKIFGELLEKLNMVDQPIQTKSGPSEEGSTMSPGGGR